MALPPLPEDIIRSEILIRLPVKSVKRFCSVCKSWKSLFSDPEFIKHHFSCTTQHDNLIVCNKTDDYYCDISVLSSPNLSETRLLHVPYFNHASDTLSEIKLLGSINGLVCMFRANLNHFILWNPATRQAKRIALPPSYADFSRSDFIGYCLDGLENDFKVVMGHRKSLVHLSTVFVLYLYSCNSNSWSRLPMLTVPLIRTISELPCTIVNGVPYWNYSGPYEQKLRVIKFDAGSKELKLLPELDVSVAGSSQPKYLIVNWRECISVLVYEPRIWDGLVCVYIFDERCGSWSKMFNFGPMPVNVHKLLGCFKYGDEIVYDVTGKYMCYNYKTNRNEVLGNWIKESVKCFNYTPSLIFLEGMKPLHHDDPILGK